MLVLLGAPLQVPANGSSPWLGKLVLLMSWSLVTPQMPFHFSLDHEALLFTSLSKSSTTLTDEIVQNRGFMFKSYTWATSSDHPGVFQRLPKSLPWALVFFPFARKTGTMT